jgi:CRISPR-associated protein Csy1
MLAELQRAYAAKRFDEVVFRARNLGVALEAQAEALILAANAAIQSGALDEADRWLDCLRTRHRDDAQLRRIHANVLNRRGVHAGDGDRRDEARNLLARALELDPQQATARFNLALEWRRIGRDDLAVPLLIELQKRNPRDEAVNLHLAECHAGAGNAEAVAQLFDAQAVHGFTEAPRWRALALAAGIDQHWAGLFAAEPEPTALAAAAVGAAMRRVDDGQREVAQQIADLALAQGAGRAPLLRAQLAARLHLPAVFDGRDALLQARAGFTAQLAALAGFDLGRVEQRLAQLEWSNFGLAYHGEDDLALQSRYGDWLVQAAQRMRPDLACLSGPPARGRPRIVLASAHWYRCTAGHYFASWVGALARDPALDVHVLAVGPRFDDLTDSLAVGGAAVHRLEGAADADRIADALRDLAPDLILYPELGMDTRLLPVAALRLAPVQAMGWGHPVSSGLATIDAFLSCAEMEPADAAAHYRESLHLLPGLGTRYLAPQRPESLTRAELGLPDAPLVVVPQSAIKIHPDNDLVYAELLRRAPRARLLLFENESSATTARLLARIEQHMEPAARARVCVQPLAARERFLQVLGACDLMLDTLHWSGGNTALDALRMGLPILTAPGRFMRGRQSAAMLATLGVAADLVVSPGQLAGRAAELLAGSSLPTLRARIDAGFPGLVEGGPALLQLRQIIQHLLDQNRKVLS